MAGQAVPVLGQSIGSNLYVQNKSGTHHNNTHNMVPITKVLKKIERFHHITFLYQAGLLKGKEVSKKVLESDDLGSKLWKLLSNLGLTYLEQSEGTYVIRPLPKLNIRPVAQQETVSGTVTDAQTGDPLPGVNILVVGTSTGTATDADGYYSLQVESLQDTLRFSYIGYQTKTMPINGRTSIDIKLKTTVLGGQELVVVGFGTQKRSQLATAVTTVNSEEIQNTPATGISEALTGKVSGLDIQSSGNGPGASSKILLRGRRSFTASNDPLIILDGIPYYGSLQDINQDDIKSISVLKDASSTAIYGSQGANGVIIITTKKGQKGKVKFSLSSYVGTKARYGKIPFQNAIQYANYKRESYRAVGTYPKGISAKADSNIFGDVELRALQEIKKNGGTGLNFQKLLFKNGLVHKHNLGISGGSDVVTYKVSGGYYYQRGIMPRNIYKRYNLQSNLTFNISSKVTAGANLFLHRINHTRKTTAFKQHGSAPSSIFQSSPLGEIRDPDGSRRFTVTSDGLLLNPLADYWWNSFHRNTNRWSGEIGVYGQVDLLPSLSYRLNLGLNFGYGAKGEYQGYYSLETNLGTPNASVSDTTNKLRLYQSILTYNHTFRGNHHLKITAVQSIQSRERVGIGGSAEQIPYKPSLYYNLGSAGKINTLVSDYSETVLSSYEGRINYDFKDKYLLSLSLRADGASQFSPEHKWGYFPAFAVGYRLSEAKFMEGAKSWLNNLKIRFSYGVTGNQGIQPYQTEGSVKRSHYSWDGGAEEALGYKPSGLENRDLKWENTAVSNLGIDFGFVNNRLTGTVAFYKSKTSNLLMYRRIPITTGYERILQNVGTTKNKGLEIDLKSENISSNNFQWSSNVVYYLNRNKIVSLYNGKEDDVSDRWFIGHPIQVYYDYKKIGIWQKDEKKEADSYDRIPGQVKVLDVNNDGKISDQDRVILGSPTA
jgi:TonB-linked SusC/RagA family outer membrane protein